MPYPHSLRLLYYCIHLHLQYQVLCSIIHNAVGAHKPTARLLHTALQYAVYYTTKAYGMRYSINTRRGQYYTTVSALGYCVMHLKYACNSITVPLQCLYSTVLELHTEYLTVL